MEAKALKREVRNPQSSGVIVPQPLKWHQRLAGTIIYATVRAVSMTLRYRWEYHPEVLRPDMHPVIFAAWHNRLPLSLIMYRHYARQRRQPQRLAAIVSASKDGGIVARVLEYFGVQPVRGSSSRRGPQALLELKSWSKRGYDIAVTPDGPRGPRYVVQSGTISLAQLTGRPIVPASYDLRWKITLKSWDRFQIPLPFGRVVMKFGKPLLVPRESSDTERDRLCQECEKRLQGLTVD